MEKRVLLAVVLSFVVLYGYQALFPPPKPTRNALARALRSRRRRPLPRRRQPGRRPLPQRLHQPPCLAAAPSASAPLVAESEERDVTFENESVEAIFTTRGGALKNWRLKKYRDAAGEPLELIPRTVPAGTLRPFTLSVPDAAASATLAQAFFKASPPVGSGSNPSDADLRVPGRERSGGAERVLFDPDSPYVVNVSATVTQAGKDLAPTIEWGPGIGSGLVASTRTYSPPPQPIFYRDGSVSRIKNTKVAENAVQEGTLGFAGVDDHYFLAAAIPGGQPVRVQYRALEVPLPSPPGTSAHFIDWSVKYNASPSRARFFLGPKDFDVLAGVDRDLVRSIDFGMFAWLVVPLLRALKWVDGYVGNYGWSIIILTILINVAMFPLRHKSVVSMRQDAGDPARGQGDPGSLREPEDDRPGEAEDEHRADEPVSRARRQSRQRLRADAADAAGAVRLLLDAVGGDRAARRAVRRVDSRSLDPRSAVHHADPHGRHAVRPAEDDARRLPIRCSRR